MPKENLTVSMDSKLVRKLQDASTEHDITVSSLVGDCVKRSISDAVKEVENIEEEPFYGLSKNIVTSISILYIDYDRPYHSSGSLPVYRLKAKGGILGMNDGTVIYKGTDKECKTVIRQIEEKQKEYREKEKNFVYVIPDIPKVEIDDIPTKATLAPEWSTINNGCELPDGWYVSSLGNGKIVPVDWESHYSGSNGEIFLQPPGFNLVDGHLVPEEYSYLNGRIVEKKEDCQNE